MLIWYVNTIFGGYFMKNVKKLGMLALVAAFVFGFVLFSCANSAGKEDAKPSDATLTAVSIANQPASGLGTPKPTWDDAGLVAGVLSISDGLAANAAVIAIAKDTKATIKYAKTGNGSTAPAFDVVSTFTLATGNYVYIEVTAQAGNKLIYKIQVTLQSENSLLTSLTISGKQATLGTPGTTAGAAGNGSINLLGAEAGSAVITPAKGNAAATVEYAVSATAPSTFGAAPGTLADGDILWIKVTSEAETVSYYKVTISISDLPIEASVIANAITGAADGNVVIELVTIDIDFGYGPTPFDVEVPTGSIVTALNDLGATGDLLATKRGTAGWDFAIPPAGGTFSTEAGAYSSVATALQTKLTGGTFTALSGTVVTVSGVTAAIADENLVLSINFVTSTISAASLTTAINGVANGDSVVIDNKGNITMTGPVKDAIDALTATSEIASVTVVGIQDAPGGYNFYLIPADGFSYAPAASTYATVAVALKTKLTSGTFTTDVTDYFGNASVDERTIGNVQAIIADPDDYNAGGPGTVVIQVFYASE
jgi:hypothetical protein